MFRDTSHGAEIENLLKSKVANLEKDYPGFHFQIIQLSDVKFSRGVGLTNGLQVGSSIFKYSFCNLWLDVSN